jgi:hypothetical protein
MVSGSAGQSYFASQLHIAPMDPPTLSCAYTCCTYLVISPLCCLAAVCFPVCA